MTDSFELGITGENELLLIYYSCIKSKYFTQGVDIMMRTMLICVIAVAFFCTAGISFADNGPADMILQAEKDKAKKPKPAVFPHQKHQEFAKCGDCHHGAKDGKQVAYAEGMKIEKCESCHFADSGMDKKLASFKNAAHQNCKDCHKTAAAEKPELAEKFKGCMPCHPKN